MLQKPLATILGENIANRRRELGLTQIALAERLGIGQDALSRMEKGTISPKISRLQEVATALDCTVAYLFREQPEGIHDFFAELGELLTSLNPDQRDVVIRAMREIVKLTK